MRRCSNCRTNYPIPRQRYCLDCKNAYTRKWRKENKTPYNQKVKARSIAGVYHRRGKLVPKLCERCGEHKVEKHHSDYNDSLKVEWLCRPCHLALHGELKKKQRLKLNELLLQIVTEVENRKVI